MAFRSVSLPAGVSGQLWLASMPGRFEPWPAFVAEATRGGLGRIVCLTPLSELVELSPQYHAAVATGELPMRWQQMPMRNFGVPRDVAGFRQDVLDIATALHHGESVLLHCAAGLGRTGTVAACVLKALGMDATAAVEAVRQAGSNPQNAQQSGLVDWF